MKQLLVLTFLAGSAFSQTPKAPADYGKDLKVTQLPNRKTEVLSVSMAFGCGNLEGLGDPKRGNEDLSLASDELLAAIPEASQTCLAELLLTVPPQAASAIAAYGGIEVDAQREKDHRVIQVLVAKYKELYERHEALLKIAEAQTSILNTRSAARPVTPVAPLPIIQMIPAPPPITPLPALEPPQRSEQIDCTSYSTGYAVNTTCTKQ